MSSNVLPGGRFVSEYYDKLLSRLGTSHKCPSIALVSWCLSLGTNIDVPVLYTPAAWASARPNDIEPQGSRLPPSPMVARSLASVLRWVAGNGSVA